MALKLLALDSDDLTIISAYSQKADLSLQNLHWNTEKSRLIMAIKRFRWEQHREYNTEISADFFCDSVLHFDRVENVSTSGMDCADKIRSYKLLAIHFVPKRHKEIHGDIMLHFENNAALRLAVECIEARLVDI